MNNLPKFDPQKENDKITRFLQDTFLKQNIQNAVIGISGGIDSAVSFSLVKQVLKPQNIYIAHLYYEHSLFDDMFHVIQNAKIPKQNIYLISIKKIVDTICTELSIAKTDNIRRGNIAARVRMIILFDLAKKYNALVVGTENKSENLLGYFTRFGDQASDVEPIEHLYKSYIYDLAKFLQIPDKIIKQKPSAGLWQDQTDEGEFGFTYQEADLVLYLAYEEKKSLAEIEKRGYLNAEKILSWKEKNTFKHNTPYKL